MVRTDAGESREGEKGRGAVAHRHVGHASDVPAADVLIEGCRILEHVLIATHEKEDEA